MSTPILCNNEEITLQKKGLIHWQDELIRQTDIADSLTLHRIEHHRAPARAD